MNAATNKQIGPLQCIVLPARKQPSIPVVILHGFGASASDLGDLPLYWSRLLGDQAERFEFIVPDAPMTLEQYGMPGARAWWPINMARLMELFETERFDELHVHEPPGIIEATMAVVDTIQAARAEAATASGLEIDQVPYAVGGFSQGAMLSAQIALQGDVPPPDLLLQFSGTLICEAKWRAASSRLGSTRVYQTHGTVDAVLPFASAKALGEILEPASKFYEFDSFEGGHGIPPEVISKTATKLADWIDGL